MSTFIIIAIIVIVLFWMFGMYNSLVRLRNQVKNGWSQIDVQLKRRHDLIPNLVETAKGYMKHERETFEAITNARSHAVEASGSGVANQAKAESELNGAIGRFMLVVENYPDLKANQNFLALQEELTSTENKVSFARQSYNDQVLIFNTKVESVPTNIMASMFNFKQAEFFEIEDSEERKAPKVQF